MALKPIISVKNMSVIYNQGLPTEFQALKDITLDIYEKEYVIFFGPSGSGKSTLMYTIAGLEVPTGGEVSVHGSKNLSELPEKDLMEYHRNFVGMIFQAFYLVPTLSAKGNIELPMVFRGVEKKEREAMSKTLMNRFGITGYQNNLPTGMSGGQQQRVAIARSLVNKPSLVLADEPVGNLDSENAAVVVDLIADLNKTDNKTVIHVTHDPRHLSRADRVFYMKDGKIERVVVNRDVTKDGEKMLVKTAMDKVAALNPYSSEEEMRAKLILNSILMPYGYDQIERIEKIIGKYISDFIDEKELEHLLDIPEEEGGAGLYKKSANKIATSVVEMVTEMKRFEVTETRTKQLQQHAVELTRYVSLHAGYDMESEQQARLVEAFAYRLSGAIGQEELGVILDEAFSKGGVGLHKRTAKQISEKVELILSEHYR